MICDACQDEIHLLRQNRLSFIVSVYFQLFCFLQHLHQLFIVGNEHNKQLCVCSNTVFLSWKHLFRHVFKLDPLGMEILQIAFPAALALAADPIASLIDTVFIGHLGLDFCSIFAELA